MDSKLKQNWQAMDVSRLQVGMYVAEIDRPWSETPFKFQGFEILSRSEIDLLARYCDTVYVDPGFVSTVATAARRSGDGDSTGADATNAINTHKLQLLNLLQDEAPHPYPVDTQLQSEQASAAAAYRHALEGLERFDRALRRGRALEAKHCRGLVSPIVHSVARNADAMVWFACLKKAAIEPGDRRVGTAIWIAVLGRHLGLTPALLLDLTSGGLLLDVGMSRMDRTLRESTQSFGGRQKLAMNGHVKLGLDLLSRIPALSDPVLEMVAQHHERLDGSGYPHGLGRDRLSPFGAIAAVADAFDAMISPASHKPARSTADAIGELNRLAGVEFAALVVEQFVQALGLFPCGSVVELNTGEIAVVCEQDARHRLRPLLQVISDADKEPLDAPRRLNLSHFSAESAARNALWIVGGHAPGAFGLELQRHFG